MKLQDPSCTFQMLREIREAGYGPVTLDEEGEEFLVSATVNGSTFRSRFSGMYGAVLGLAKLLPEPVKPPCKVGDVVLLSYYNNANLYIGVVKAVEPNEAYSSKFRIDLDGYHQVLKEGKPSKASESCVGVFGMYDTCEVIKAA